MDFLTKLLGTPTAKNNNSKNASSGVVVQKPPSPSEKHPNTPTAESPKPSPPSIVEEFSREFVEELVDSASATPDQQSLCDIQSELSYETLSVFDTASAGTYDDADSQGVVAVVGTNGFRQDTDSDISFESAADDNHVASKAVLDQSYGLSAVTQKFDTLHLDSPSSYKEAPVREDDPLILAKIFGKPISVPVDLDDTDSFIHDTTSEGEYSLNNSVIETSLYSNALDVSTSEIVSQTTEPSVASVTQGSQVADSSFVNVTPELIASEVSKVNDLSVTAESPEPSCVSEHLNLEEVAVETTEPICVSETSKVGESSVLTVGSETPEPICVPEPPNVENTPEPISVTVPPTVETTPAPISVSELPNLEEFSVKTPESSCVSEPPNVEETPVPICVSEPPNVEEEAVETPEPICVSEPPNVEEKAVETPEPICVSEPPNVEETTIVTPEPNFISELPNVEETPEPISVSETPNVEETAVVTPELRNVEETAVVTPEPPNVEETPECISVTEPPKVEETAVETPEPLNVEETPEPISVSETANVEATAVKSPEPICVSEPAKVEETTVVTPGPICVRAEEATAESPVPTSDFTEEIAVESVKVEEVFPETVDAKESTSSTEAPVIKEETADVDNIELPVSEAVSQDVHSQDQQIDVPVSNKEVPIVEIKSDIVGNVDTLAAEVPQVESLDISVSPQHKLVDEETLNNSVKKEVFSESVLETAEKFEVTHAVSPVLEVPSVDIKSTKPQDQETIIDEKSPTNSELETPIVEKKSAFAFEISDFTEVKPKRFNKKSPAKEPSAEPSTEPIIKPKDNTKTPTKSISDKFTELNSVATSPENKKPVQEFVEETLTSLENESTLNDLLTLCNQQQKELDSCKEKPDEIGDLLAAEADLVCQEIHNASLINEADDDFLNMCDSLDTPRAPPRKSASPRQPSPTPDNGDTKDPFSPRNRLASSPPRDDMAKSTSPTPGGASMSSSSDSAVAVSSGGKLQRDASTESAGSPKSIPSMDSGICGAEVNHSEAGPDIAAAEEQFYSSELFKDPNAFEFLSSLTGRNAATVSRLERESLYVKFDPLVGNQDRKVYLSPCLETSRNEDSYTEDSPMKPPQVRPPHVTDRHQSTPPSSVGMLVNINNTPVSRHRDASPAAKADTPPRGREESPAPTLQQVTFAQELLDRQKKVFEDRLAELEKQLESAKKDTEDAKKVVNIQVRQLHDAKKAENQMSLVMKEYEDTISSILIDKEHAAEAWNKEKASLEAERNQATADLAGAELAFSDLHQKYERAKVALQGMKNNEMELKSSNQKFQEQLKAAGERYLKLKNHAEAQLEKANMEIEGLMRAKEMESAALNAQVKQLKAKVANMEEVLSMRDKENRELVAICDELVAKMGNGGQ